MAGRRRKKSGDVYKRQNLGVSYEKQKDYIKNLYKNEDYMTLDKVFRCLLYTSTSET